MGSGRLPAASTWTPERPGRISSGGAPSPSELPPLLDPVVGSPIPLRPRLLSEPLEPVRRPVTSFGTPRARPARPRAHTAS